MGLPSLRTDLEPNTSRAQGALQRIRLTRSSRSAAPPDSPAPPRLPAPLPAPSPALRPSARPPARLEQWQWEMLNSTAIVRTIVNDVLVRGYAVKRARDRWASYQEAVVGKFAASVTELQKVPLRVLMVTYVDNSERCVNSWADNVQKLRADPAGDHFDFAFFHFDSNNSLYQRQDWYTHPSVKIRHVGIGCPSMFWFMLNFSFVKTYDYVWMSDGDMHLGFFSWSVYRVALVKLRPLVSQPAILPAFAGGLSTGVPILRMTGVRRRQRPLLAREVIRSEVMMPMLSVRVWKALHQRLAGNDQHNMWFTDAFWDFVAFAGKGSCKTTGPLLVEASPARHLNWQSLKSATGNSTKCTSSRNGGRAFAQNDRPLGTKELTLAGEGLQGYCDKANKSLPRLARRKMGQCGLIRGPWREWRV